jgi:hypothetical protein
MTAGHSSNIWTTSEPWSLASEHALAQRWDKSVRTLQRWRSEGYGPPYIRIGGTIHYRVGDVFAFEDRQRHGGEEL